MTALFLAIAPLLTKLPGMLGEYFKKKQEIEIIKAETMRDVAVEKQKLASALAKAEAERAVNALKATSKGFKQLVFLLLSTPFMASLLGFPEYSEMVFNNLRTLPEWYLIMYTSVVGVIFGIPVPGSVMGNIWNGLKQSTVNRREFKLERERIRSDKKLFDVIRGITQRPLVQEEVDRIKEANG